MRSVLSRSRDRPDGKHGRGRPRLHWLGLCLLLLLGPASSVKSAFSQSKTAGREERERRALREQWFLRGRSSPGEAGAGQRYRAYLQKMRMRAAGLAAAQMIESAA